MGGGSRPPSAVRLTLSASCSRRSTGLTKSDFWFRSRTQFCENFVRCLCRYVLFDTFLFVRTEFADLRDCCLIICVQIN